MVDDRLADLAAVSGGWVGSVDVSHEPLPDDQLVVETRRYYGEVFRTAWRTVALSSAIVLLVVLFNSEPFVLGPEEAERVYVRFTVSPPEGLGFLGVLAALVIALVVEVDQSARIVRSDRESTPTDELGIRAVRLRVAQWTSTVLGYGAVLCGLLVIFTSEEVFEARTALTALAGGLVFAFTLLVNLGAENAQALLRELNHRATELMHSRIVYWLGVLGPGTHRSGAWRRAFADFWAPNGSRARATARRLLLNLESRGLRQSVAVVAGLLVAAMVVAAALFGWRAMIWTGMSGVIWVGVAAFGIVLITRDILAGARALPSLELLFLSIAGLIVSVLVWISSGGTTSAGLVDTERWRMLIAVVPGLMFAAFVVASAATLLLTASGAFGHRWLTERVVGGLTRRRRVLDDVVGRIQRAARPPDGGDLSVP